MLLAAALGCTGENGATGITDRQFIDAMAELRGAALVAGPDTALFMELRAEALETHGVTEGDLRAYVSARSSDLAHMAEMWDSVGARLATPVADPVVAPVIDPIIDDAADSLPATADSLNRTHPDSVSRGRIRGPRLRGVR